MNVVSEWCSVHAAAAAAADDDDDDDVRAYLSRGVDSYQWLLQPAELHASIHPAYGRRSIAHSPSVRTARKRKRPRACALAGWDNAAGCGSCICSWSSAGYCRSVARSADGSADRSSGRYCRRAADKWNYRVARVVSGEPWNDMVGVGVGRTDGRTDAGHSLASVTYYSAMAWPRPASSRVTPTRNWKIWATNCGARTTLVSRTSSYK